MKKLISFSFLFICLPSILLSQTLEGRTVLDEPVDYRGIKESVAMTLRHSGKTLEKSPWIVFSDRSNNFTVNSPGGLQKNKTLNFLEEFYVLEERQDFLWLVKDLNINPSNYQLSQNAEDYGWIRKENLLLWRSAIMTDDTKILKKAMTQNTIEVIEGKYELLMEEGSFEKLYFDPEFKIPTGREIRLYQIYYVFKITNDAVLVGRSDWLPTRDDNQKQQVIEGWIPKHRLVMWDHRIAVEPNWTSEAVAERRRNNTKATVFSSHQAASQYKSGKSSLSNVIIDESTILGDFYRERQSGPWQRYPVYSNIDGILKLGIMGEITTPSGFIDNITMAETRSIRSNVMRQRRNINIVFVMDGTNSMQPYFKPAADAVIQSMTELEKEKERRNTLRFGAVVYRDEAERSFNRLVEVKGLTEDYKDVAGWLSKVKAEEYGVDKDLAEAVYYGLREALMSVLVEDDETNIVVLVGDAGNHNRNDASQVGEGLIIDMLAEKNVGFLAFQVINDQHPTYNEFQNQIKHLMLHAARQIHRRMKTTGQLLQGVYGDPKWSQVSSNIYRLDNHSNMATLVYPNKGSMMPTSVLTKEIVALVEFADKSISVIDAAISDIDEMGRSLEEVIESLEKSPLSNSKYVSSFNPAMIYILHQMGLDPGTLKSYSDKKIQLYMQGYSPLLIEGQRNPHYKNSLLLSKHDLADLVRTLNQLNRASSATDRRRSLQDTWQDILIKHIGETDRSSILNRTIEEIMLTVFGLPSTNSLINRIRLSDLTEAKAISDAEISRYIMEIDRKYHDLNRIFNQTSPPYQFSFESNNITYYWIEEGLLP